MSTQRYTSAEVYWNGALLAEEASVTVSRKSNSQTVLTVHKGFAGKSQGAPQTMIEVESAVPSSDFELNPGRFINDLEPGELSIFAAGRTLTVKGFIDEDTFKHAVNSSSSLSFSFEGGPSDWT